MENLVGTEAAETRVIEGSIAADGTILDGCGFTVTHLGTGAYSVKFNEAFYFSPPNVLKFDVLDGSEEPYGYKAEIIGKMTKTGFKYFTYELTETNLIMKDIEIEFFYIWGLKKPTLNSCPCDQSKAFFRNSFMDY